MAKTRRGFPVDGMLLLDKPEGLSSNQALQRAKHLLHARKAGHTGSLDPLATGLLPLCFGETTKISSLFLGADSFFGPLFDRPMRRPMAMTSRTSSLTHS